MFISGRIEHEGIASSRFKKKFKAAADRNLQGQVRSEGLIRGIEKIKAGFDAERATWEYEKTALVKRDEEAEAHLKTVTDELAGLKQHITHMTAAIFGKF